MHIVLDAMVEASTELSQSSFLRNFLSKHKTILYVVAKAPTNMHILKWSQLARPHRVLPVIVLVFKRLMIRLIAVLVRNTSLKFL